MSHKLPLSGIKVFEMAGLAPVPFAGMILADFGANVIRIDRSEGLNIDVLARNKRSIALNLKSPDVTHLLLELFKTADVILDPFRPGVMEKLGLGPDVVCKLNPRIIYARLSGFGQTGSKVAGHDINYLAVAGVLDMIGRQGEKPFFPMNILADFAGGGLLCVMGVLMAIIERSNSGQGQIIDASLVGGASYLTTWPYLMQKHGLLWEDERGTNLLDGGAPFYEVYTTKDNLYMAVGAIEPQFYSCLLEKLGLQDQELPHQMEKESWPRMKTKFQDIFSQKTQREWTEIFDGSDACVTPVLSFNQPGLIQSNGSDSLPRIAPMPQPAPVLSRTPANKHRADEKENQGPPFLEPGKHSIEILSEFGISRDRIQRLVAANVLVDVSKRSRL